jgi:DNA-binding response OmpR family regulator
MNFALGCNHDEDDTQTGNELIANIFGLTPNLWRLFTLLYGHRGDVVDNDRIQAELYREMEQPIVANLVKENVRRLRRALAGSRYEIVNHPTLGYELIVRDDSARRRRHY